MLECYHMQDSKLIETPVDKSLSLSCDMCPKNLEKKGENVQSTLCQRHW
jgi:hypothetical protein